MVDLVGGPIRGLILLLGSEILAMLTILTLLVSLGTNRRVALLINMGEKYGTCVICGAGLVVMTCLRL